MRFLLGSAGAVHATWDQVCAVPGLGLLIWAVRPARLVQHRGKRRDASRLQRPRHRRARVLRRAPGYRALGLLRPERRHHAFRPGPAGRRVSRTMICEIIHRDDCHARVDRSPTTQFSNDAALQEFFDRLDGLVATCKPDDPAWNEYGIPRTCTTRCAQVRFPKSLRVQM